MGSSSSPSLIIFKSLFFLMFQVTDSHWWAKVSLHSFPTEDFVLSAQFHCSGHLSSHGGKVIMKPSMGAPGKLPALHTQRYWKRQGRTLWICSGLSKNSQHWETLSCTGKREECLEAEWDGARQWQRLQSNIWNKIILPINFLFYLIFSHVVPFPCWIWPTPCFVQFLYAKGLPIDGTALFSSGLLISPAVGMKNSN